MKISTILRETNIPQVKGHLIKFNLDNELEGKCALGVLACESKDKELHLSQEREWVSVSAIIKSYGIDDGKGYPYMEHMLDEFDNVTYGFDFNKTHTIQEIIVILNDMYEFDFKQIADFLEVTFDL